MALDYQRVIDQLDDGMQLRIVGTTTPASIAAATTADGVTLMAPSASRSAITPRGVGRR